MLIHQGGQTTAATLNDQSCPGLSGEILPIVDAIGKDVDVVVSGHTHQEYVCTRNGKLLTSTGFYGSAATEIDLKITPPGGVTEKIANTVPVINDLNTTVPTRYTILAKDAGCGRMLQPSGDFTYMWDASKPAGAAERTGNRIVAGSLRIGGVGVDLTKTYRVTFNSFNAPGPGDNFSVITTAGKNTTNKKRRDRHRCLRGLHEGASEPRAAHSACDTDQLRCDPANRRPACNPAIWAAMLLVVAAPLHRVDAAQSAQPVKAPNAPVAWQAQVTAAARDAQAHCHGEIHHDTFAYEQCVSKMADTEPSAVRRLGIDYFGYVGAMNSQRLSMMGAEESAHVFLERFRRAQKQFRIGDLDLCRTVPGDCDARVAGIKFMERATPARRRIPRDASAEAQQAH